MNEEGENEFVGEQVQDIVRNAVTKTLGNAQYNKDKVYKWSETIIEECLKELCKLNKPFKYVVTCIIMEKNGSKLHKGFALYWATQTDGVTSVQCYMDTMDCIATVFACMN